MHQQIQCSICPFGLQQESQFQFPEVQKDYGAFVRTILIITTPIQVPAPASANPRQHVRVYSKLLRLLELYRPSYALHQNLDRRECKEKMRQSTSRAFHCGLGYLQHMSIARTLVTPSTNEESKSILEVLARPLRPEGSQSPTINTYDAGDVEAQILGHFIISHADKRHQGPRA